MQVIRDFPNRQMLTSSVVTIGNFDGLHLGHQALIRRCQERAGGDRPVAVISFEPLPHTWFRPDDSPARLMSVRQKLGVLRSLDVDLVWLMRFNRALAGMEAPEFVDRVLVRTLGAADVVVGPDFRYGSGRAGDTGSLAAAGAEAGFSLDVMPMLEVGGERVSSTTIRHYLENGDLDAAARLLGRPYSVTARVIRGRQLGRELGYPTANMRLESAPSPVKGVFAVRVRWGDNGWHDGVANLGTRPVVDGGEFLAEAHLFDFDGDLYGERLEMRFVRKLRDEQRFEDIDDLVAQMREDERQARDCLAST